MTEKKKSKIAIRNELSERFGISRRTIERSGWVLSNCHPELDQALEKGLLKMGMAERLIKFLPQDEYLKIIRTGDKDQIRQLAKKALAIPMICNPPKFNEQSMIRQCNRLVNRYHAHAEFIEYWREFIADVDSNDSD